MDVSLLQVEAAGHRAVAEPLAEQGEGQPDGLGQGQTGPSRKPGPGLRGLEQLCDSLEGGGRHGGLSKNGIFLVVVSFVKINY